VFDAADQYGGSETKRSWRRNIVRHSESLSNAAWYGTNTANGSSTGGVFSVSTSEGYAYLAQDLTGSSTTTDHVVSFDVTCDQTISNVPFRLAGTVNVSQLANLTAGVTVRLTFTGYRPFANQAVQLGIDARSAVVVGGSDATGYNVTVSRVQVEQGSTPTEYQRITDFSSDFLAAFPNHSLYQDVNGQTPVTAPGDPIGLQLDTSRGGLDALGSDLVTNGTFDADANWTKGANWTIGSGVATKTGGAANNLTQTISSTAGLWYRCTATVTRTAGTLTISLGTSGTSFAVSASGTYTFFLLAGSSTQTLTFAGDSSFAGTVDAVTARLVPGTHRYQSTSGSRPVLARIPEGGRRNLLTYSDATLGAVSGSPGTPPTNWTRSGWGWDADGPKWWFAANCCCWRANKLQPSSFRRC
jgi:hypothetical protein